MRGHNICFHLEIRKIIFELSSILLLIWSLDYVIDDIDNVYKCFAETFM